MEQFIIIIILEWSNSSTFEESMNRIHIIFNNGNFKQNKYDNSLIDGYCSIINIFDSEFEENELIHSDTCHILMENMEFLDNKVSKYGIIYDENSHYDRAEYHINNCIFNNNLGGNSSCVAMIYNSSCNMAPELIVDTNANVTIICCNCCNYYSN